MVNYGPGARKEEEEEEVVVVVVMREREREGGCMFEGRGGGGLGKNEQKKDGEECLNWLKKWGKNIYLACSFLLYINIITYICVILDCYCFLWLTYKKNQCPTPPYPAGSYPLPRYNK